MHAKAQWWADQLAIADPVEKGQPLPHSGTSGVGESIYYTKNPLSVIIKGIYPVNAWYEEKYLFGGYDFKEQNYRPATGLYSSVIQCEYAHFLN